MNEKRTQVRLQQGCLLHTPITRRWTQAQREEAESRERRTLFLGFTPIDEGRSRVRVADCVNDEFAHRLVACWNACEGMEDPEAEVAALRKDSDYLMASEKLRAQVIEQRDELLAALERAERKLSAYVGVCTGDKELTEAVLPLARAAIAKVKGGAA